MKPLQIISGLLLASVIVAPGPASAADQLEWDQAKVTAIAQELPKAADDLRNALRNEPGTLSGSAGGRRSFHRFTDTVRRIDREARQLAASLKAGKGHDETLPIMENLAVLVRDGRDQARNLFRTDSLTNRIAAGRAVLDRLTPYYDMRPLPPPLTRDAP